jgi:toxin-antitoxin system PIN domain toxin
LFDSAHVHHVAAHAWFARNGRRGWRTCPITENGLLRILSHPGYPNGPLPISDLAQRLEEFKSSSPHYDFWPDDFSASQWLCSSGRSPASGRLTDAYLLKLADSRKGALATFDLRIAPSLIGASTAATLEYITV